MNIRALTFDTGGTILDWHGGLFRAFDAAGQRRGITADWHEVTNEYRRRAMRAILGTVGKGFNFDDIHREVLDEMVEPLGLQALTRADRDEIWGTWHHLNAWPDFVPALRALRKRHPVVSFTMLPTSVVIDVSRSQGFDWDAVISCEMIGTYKPHPDAYLTAARWLALPPAEILMVACHNFDLDAARACGFNTAFVRRPDEWGPAGPPDPTPNPAHDIIVDTFPQLAQALGCPV